MIESLNSLLGSGREDYLNRIYLSTKLQNFLKTTHPDPVKVVVKNKVISLICSSPAQATHLRLKKRRLFGEINNIIGHTSGYTIRIKVRP
jgi:hypothetical protein